MKKRIILVLIFSFCFLNVGFAADNNLDKEAGHTWKAIVIGDTSDRNKTSTPGFRSNLSMHATASATGAMSPR